MFKETFRWQHPAKKGRSFYWNSFIKKKVTTDELAEIPSWTCEFQRQNQNLSRIFAKNRWFVKGSLLVFDHFDQSGCALFTLGEPNTHNDILRRI